MSTQDKIAALRAKASAEQGTLAPDLYDAIMDTAAIAEDLNGQVLELRAAPAVDVGAQLEPLLDRLASLEGRAPAAVAGAINPALADVARAKISQMREAGSIPGMLAEVLEDLCGSTGSTEEGGVAAAEQMQAEQMQQEAAPAPPAGDPAQTVTSGEVNSGGEGAQAPAPAEGTAQATADAPQAADPAPAS